MREIIAQQVPLNFCSVRALGNDCTKMVAEGRHCRKFYRVQNVKIEGPSMPMPMPMRFFCNNPKDDSGKGKFCRNDPAFTE